MSEREQVLDNLSQIRTHFEEHLDRLDSGVLFDDLKELKILAVDAYIRTANSPDFIFIGNEN